MNDNKRFLQPEKLPEWLQETRQSALLTGSLQSLSTELLTFSGEIPYEVRKLSSLRNKPTRKPSDTVSRNPFLPYEKELYVCHLQTGHVMLLNKFNVVDDHLLIVTPDFEPQEEILAEKEFRATLEVIETTPMLAFYNSGREAGASQPHRHVQAFPLTTLPISEAMENAAHQPEPIPSLPFPNLAVDIFNLPVTEIYSHYLNMIKQLHLCNESKQKPLPYNLLMTSHWMMLIPRTQDRYEGISINALGFAGLILVKNDEQLRTVQSIGVERLLAEVCS